MPSSYCSLLEIAEMRTISLQEISELLSQSVSNSFREKFFSNEGTETNMKQSQEIVQFWYCFCLRERDNSMFIV